MTATHVDWLIDQMALELRKDLDSITGRIKRASVDPAVRARLAMASATYLFEAACAAQQLATPAPLGIIAASLGADLVDAASQAGPGLCHA